MRLVKEVDVTYSRGEDYRCTSIKCGSSIWKPHGGGPYPAFSGTLTVRSDEDYTGCILDLAGAYEPPMGAVGAAFDVVVGSRLAAGSAAELLRTLGERLKSRYRENEESKKAAQ